MERDLPNIYRNARRISGYSKERWAELCGVTPESIRLYETGKCLPSDAVVTRMADVAPMPILALWHLKEKSGIANDLLPDVEAVELPQAVIKLLCEIRDFKQSTDELLTIAADGYVSDDESDAFLEILEALDGVVHAALQVKYSQVRPKEAR